MFFYKEHFMPREYRKRGKRRRACTMNPNCFKTKFRVLHMRPTIYYMVDENGVDCWGDNFIFPEYTSSTEPTTLLKTRFITRP